MIGLLRNVVSGLIFCINYSYGDVSYHTPKMDSFKLNNFSFLTRHLTNRLQAEKGYSFFWMISFFLITQ